MWYSKVFFICLVGKEYFMCLGKHFFNVLRNRGKEMSSRMSSAKTTLHLGLKSLIRVCLLVWIFLYSIRVSAQSAFRNTLTGRISIPSERRGSGA